ncbi:hypothetical protein, partial [Klebsiella pneumoniae]
KACVLPENPASYRVVRTKSYLFNKATRNYVFTKKSMEIVNPVSLTTDTSYCRTKFDIGKKK